MGFFDNVFDFVSDLADGVGNIASSVVESVGDAAEATVDTIGEMVGATVDTVGNVVSSTADVVGYVAESIVDVVQEIPDGISTLVDDVGETVFDGIADSPIGFVLEPIMQVNDRVKSVAASIPGVSVVESLVDNVIRDSVSPIPGSIVYCSLFGLEHSGVYIGDGYIVELLGTGRIRKTDRSGFTDGTNALTVYVSTYRNHAIGNSNVAHRARQMIYKQTDYNFVMNNCHKFTVGCITGDFDNFTITFAGIASEIRQYMNGGRPIEWRAWG